MVMPEAAPPAVHAQACAIVGDSLAVGIAEHLRRCLRNARVGLPSDAIARRTKATPTSVVVISAGSNDAASPDLADNLRRIRRRSMGRRIVWIAPADAHAARIVARVAAEHGDAVVRARSVPLKRDGVHPRDYARLAAGVAARMVR
jgi:transposase